MTALTVICRPDAAFILTDGAVESSGEIVASCCKAFPIPHARAVYVGRGDMLVTMPVLFAMNIKGSLDVMAADLPRAVRDVEALLEREYGKPPAASEHCVTGWSDEHGAFVSHFMSTTGRDGAEPRQVVTLGAFISPTPSVEFDPLTFDPIQDGPALMQSQRATTAEGRVGGFAQLTSVYMDRIETRILERWTD